ncbi:stage V sporulation protein AE [Bacillota bacterium LX-D]|nr:stage V sporulation protein AE [Bacillota bacterium LX-D]
MKRKVIIITDGDKVAQRCIENIAQKVGGRCISLSAGNPTPLKGSEIVELIKQAHHDPVFVMFDDRGCCSKGPGEKAMEYIGKDPDIEILGAVAVASNTSNTKGIKVDYSVTSEGTLVDQAVDKFGNSLPSHSNILYGDTVDALNHLNIPIVIGTGDTGKMDGADDIKRSSPVTTKAIIEILKKNGYNLPVNG